MSLVVGSTEIDQGGGKPKWETPTQHGASLVRRLMQAGWPKGVLLNVNFPDCEPDAVKGSAATVQGQRDPDMLRVVERIDTRGRAYYWLGIQRRNSKPPKGTDIWAVRPNLISVRLRPSVLILRTNKLSPALNPSSTLRGLGGNTRKHFVLPKRTEPKPNSSRLVGVSVVGDAKPEWPQESVRRGPPETLGVAKLKGGLIVASRRNLRTSCKH